ncbi:MAG TPA: outer membrane protein assembly factor BamD [Vicinamibacterales bacterium]|nr:outer membrane protein assembly factor BamD [Vicinamibacterales bacterium]
MTSFTRVAVVALFGAFLAGCAAHTNVLPPGTTRPDQYLYKKGEAAMTAHRWADAQEDFQKILDNYPQSSYRPAARLGVGDAYLNENTPESLVLALNAYREFLTYYPTSTRADYAQYQLAMTHFKQMRGPQRDQTQTHDAIDAFETFLQRYPTSKLVPDVQKKLREAHDRLDEASFDVGHFYYTIHWYPGAIDRFESILKDDPQYSGRDAVYFYLGESLIQVKRQAEALPYFVQLVRQFEKSQYLADAQKRIASLKQSLGLDKPTATASIP